MGDKNNSINQRMQRGINEDSTVDACDGTLRTCTFSVLLAVRRIIDSSSSDPVLCRRRMGHA